jgi:hypothetical protein
MPSKALNYFYVDVYKNPLRRAPAGTIAVRAYRAARYAGDNGVSTRHKSLSYA